MFIQNYGVIESRLFECDVGLRNFLIEKNIPQLSYNEKTKKFIFFSSELLIELVEQYKREGKHE